MSQQNTSIALIEEAEKILEKFRDGLLRSIDYDFGMALPVTSPDFSDWIADLDSYEDVDADDLEGEKKIIFLKNFIPSATDERIIEILENPKLITEEETLQWQKLRVKDDIYLDFYVLVPIESGDRESGAVIICDYSNIPGGEFEIVEVFSCIKEAKHYLERYTLRD